MSASNFALTRHTVPGQHIRHYARGTATSQEAVLQLAVNQYTPKDAGQPQPGDVTILACHASGFPKELYEPVWDAMLEHTRRTAGFRIRNIWIADVSNQNASGVLNEDLIGNERTCYPWCLSRQGLLAPANPSLTNTVSFLYCSLIL